MSKIKITNLATLHQRPEGAITLDTIKAAATREKAPQVIQWAQDGRYLVVCPGGAVMGTTTPYSHEEAYDLAFRVALQREWARPVEWVGEVGK